MIFSKRKNTRRPRKPTWLIARAALVLAALFFAAFAVVFWGLGLAETSPILAVFVSVGFAVSAIVTPTVVPKLAVARGPALAGLLFVAVVFGLVDSLGVTMGFSGLGKLISEPAYKTAVAAYDEAELPLKMARDKAIIDRDAVKLETAFSDGRKFGPQNKAAALVTFKEARAEYQAIIDGNEAKIKALTVPVRGSIFDLTLIGLLSIALQVALAVGMIALEAARESVHRSALAEYEAGLQSARAERDAKAKAKAKVSAKLAKDAAAVAARAAKMGGPKLAFDADRN
jgi:hypothetical protein